jgi:beta-glucanase (GH16 family)
MENVGRDPNGIHQVIHCGAYSSKTENPRKAYTVVNDPSNTFHVYSVDWNGDRIKFFIDGINYFTYHKHMNQSSTWPYDGYFNIILNLG